MWTGVERSGALFPHINTEEKHDLNVYKFLRRINLLGEKNKQKKHLLLCSLKRESTGRGHLIKAKLLLIRRCYIVFFFNLLLT